MQYARTFKNRISVSTYSNTFLRIWGITMDSLDDLLDSILLRILFKMCIYKKKQMWIIRESQYSFVVLIFQKKIFFKSRPHFSSPPAFLKLTPKRLVNSVGNSFELKRAIFFVLLSKKCQNCGYFFAPLL